MQNFEIAFGEETARDKGSRVLSLVASVCRTTSRPPILDRSAHEAARSAR
jgi:hypothetical protein